MDWELRVAEHEGRHNEYVQDTVKVAALKSRLQRTMKETAVLNSQDIDRVVEDSFDEEGVEMVADDAKKGTIPIQLVNQAKSEEQK